MGQAAIPIAIGSMVLGTGMQFYSGMRQAEAYGEMAGLYNQIGQMNQTLYRHNAAVYQAEAAKLRRIGEYNKTAAEIDARAVIEDTNLQARDLWEYGNTLMGKQRVAFGSAGVEMSGNPVDVMLDTLNLVERDATRIIDGGEKAAERARLMGLSDAMMADLEATRAEGNATIQSLMGQISLLEAKAQYQSLGYRQQAAGIGAWTSLLSGGANIALMTTRT